MVNAEELQIDSQNVEEKKVSTNPAVKRLLGVEGNFGEMLGVGNDWAYNVIKMVGNYGEVFRRKRRGQHAFGYRALASMRYGPGAAFNMHRQ